MPQGAHGDVPVFVDETGGRSRAMRRTGYVAGAACCAYALVLVGSLVARPAPPDDWGFADVSDAPSQDAGNSASAFPGLPAQQPADQPHVAQQLPQLTPARPIAPQPRPVSRPGRPPAVQPAPRGTGVPPAARPKPRTGVEKSALGSGDHDESGDGKSGS